MKYITIAILGTIGLILIAFTWAGLTQKLEKTWEEEHVVHAEPAPPEPEMQMMDSPTGDILFFYVDDGDTLYTNPFPSEPPCKCCCCCCK